MGAIDPDIEWVIAPPSGSTDPALAKLQIVRWPETTPFKFANISANISGSIGVTKWPVPFRTDPRKHANLQEVPQDTDGHRMTQRNP